MTTPLNLVRAEVLLSFQRALWGAVTPELRSVSVGWSSGQIEATFVYDCPISNEVAEIVSVVETEVLADFPPGVLTQFELIHMPLLGDRRDTAREWWVYMRKEW